MTVPVVALSMNLNNYLSPHDENFNFMISRIHWNTEKFHICV